MTTMPTDLASEQAYAQENRSRVIQRLPPRLAAREEQLLAKFERNKGAPLRKLELLFAFMDELYGAKVFGHIVVASGNTGENDIRMVFG